MTYNIQPEFDCKDCIKCGQRPVVEQVKKMFKIKCPNKDCNNAVSGSILNFAKWDEQNKPQLIKNESNNSIKKTA